LAQQIFARSVHQMRNLRGLSRCAAFAAIVRMKMQ
jgi:hypothetical protein